MVVLSILVLFIIYHFWVVYNLNKKIKIKRFENMKLKSEVRSLKTENCENRKILDLKDTEIINLCQDLKNKEREFNILKNKKS